VYLKYAIRYLPGFHPRLGEMENGKFINALRFLNYTDTIRDVLQLGGGTGDLSFLLNEYRTIEAKYGHRPWNFLSSSSSTTTQVRGTSFLELQRAYATLRLRTPRRRRFII